MNDTQLTLAINEAPNYTDPDAFVSDILLSAAFIEPGDDDAQPDLSQIDDLRTVWTVVAAPFRDYLALLGMGQSELSRTHHVPLRTVQNWAIGATSCPTYARIMLAQLHGLWPC